MLDWGEHVDFLERMASQGHHIPALASRVQPDPHLLFEWKAFFELNSERPAGFGRAPIPWGSIIRYARFHRLDFESTERLLVLIRAMDNAFLSNRAERDAVDGKKAKA